MRAVNLIPADPGRHEIGFQRRRAFGGNLLQEGAVDEINAGVDPPTASGLVLFLKTDHPPSCAEMDLAEPGGVRRLHQDQA